MASLFDAIQLLKNIGVIQVILPFLLITTIVYAFLTKTETFGKNNTANLIISGSLGLIFISFEQSVTFVLGIVPLFLGFFIVILLMYLLFSFMGVKPELLGETFSSTTVVVVVLVIFLIFISVLLPNIIPSVSPYGTEAGAGEAVITSSETGEVVTVATQPTVFSETTRAFFNPSVIGVIALLLVAAGTMYFVTSERKTM